MTHVIIYDPEQNIAALVDPEAPAALGPVTVGDPGDDPRHPLTEFVNGLDQPPESIPTWVLFNEWQAYVRAIVDLVEQAIEEDHQAAEAAGTTEPTPEAPPAPQEAAEEATGADTASTENLGDGSELETTEEEETELSARIAAAPHTPAKDHMAECWLCGGSGSIDTASGPAECSVCEGRGTVPREGVQQ